VVSCTEEYVYILGKPAVSCGKVAVFVDEDVYNSVKNFVDIVGVKVDSDYWEENKHDKIVNLLAQTTGYERDEISNSLCALRM
jgi:hypothetical protein